MAVRIKSVNKGSAAEKLGLRAGDTLLSADGNEINDMLDYEFYSQGPVLELAVVPLHWLGSALHTGQF